MAEQKKTTPKNNKKEKNIVSFIPFIIGGVILLLIIVAVIRIIIWNKGEKFEVDPDYEIGVETQDYLFFMNPALIEGNEYDGNFDVVILGNDMYLYDGDGKSITEMLQEDINGTVYNCALKGSRLCSVNDHWDEEFPENNNPMDAFDFFWISESIQHQDYSRQWTELERLPAEIDRAHYSEVLRQLESIDFNTVDLLLVCYDGQDFLNDFPGAIVDQPYTILSMEGTMGAVYEKYGPNYPSMQLMFVAPTYCYKTLPDGTKKGADLPNEYGLSLPDSVGFVLAKSMDYSVSYLDNYLGININSETADEYLLEDGITPNEKGRKMIADRIVKYVNERLAVK